MIPPEKIDQWLQEAEERPWSAALLIRHIANRLNELTQWNEELQAENIALRSDKKVEEYERQIATLDYQLGLLKRQLGDEALLTLPERAVSALAPSLQLFTPQGQVLRLELAPEQLKSGQVLAHFATASNLPVRMFVASPTEEILFAFDTGRVVSMPLAEIPVVRMVSAGSTSGQTSVEPVETNARVSTSAVLLDWEQAYVQLPVGSEELVDLLPIARLPLYESVVQVSRKACVKKVREVLFKGYLTKSYIGSGVKASPDRLFTLVACQPDDALVLVSKDGYLSRLAVADLPITIEESLRLGITDHLVAAFAVGEKPSLLVVTNNGKVIHREQGWLQNGPLKSKGYAAFSETRRRAGIAVAGAAAVSEDDWCVALLADGRLIVAHIADLFQRGVLLPEENVNVLGFATWSG